MIKSTKLYCTDPPFQSLKRNIKFLKLFTKYDKGRHIKSIKLEMKMERSQQTTQKYKG